MFSGERDGVRVDVEEKLSNDDATKVSVVDWRFSGEEDDVIADDDEVKLSGDDAIDVSVVGSRVRVDDFEVKFSDDDAIVVGSRCPGEENDVKVDDGGVPATVLRYPAEEELIVMGWEDELSRPITDVIDNVDLDSDIASKFSADGDDVSADDVDVSSAVAKHPGLNLRKGEIWH